MQRAITYAHTSVEAIQFGQDELCLIQLTRIASNKCTPDCFAFSAALCTVQLFKAQAKQGSTDSSAQHPLPAGSGGTAQSHLAADARQQLTNPSSIQGTPVPTAMSKTVATVRAAIAQLGRIPNQNVCL